jgi:RecA-family ATPase
VALEPQNLARFRAKKFPPKEPLIDGVLYRRDRISLTGRRRHGKTTALLNIALTGALGLSDYLGFSIPKPFAVIAYFLEDDAEELQGKLNKMLQGRELTAEQSQRLHIYTRSDLRSLGIKIEAGDADFRKFIEATCKAAQPQLIVFDKCWFAELTTIPKKFMNSWSWCSSWRKASMPQSSLPLTLASRAVKRMIRSAL